MLTGVLKVLRLPPQCTFWRFLASLHLGIARQLLTVQRHMRERVWQAAHVGLKTATLYSDATVHTLFGHQMRGRKGYNPKNKGKKSYQPILTFLAETREYGSGELHNGDRPTGPEIARQINCNHFQLVMLAYNLNCWLMLFNREEQTQIASLKHTTLATARLRFLFLAAKIWRLADRVGVSYSDHYADQGIFHRLMDRLWAIASDGRRFGPVLSTALRE